MFRNLKRRLILLYGITSSIIITVIIIGVFIINNRQNQEQAKMLFQKNVEQITEKIRSENVVSSTWLTKLYEENHIIIYIEDNGKLLTSLKQLKSDDESVNYIKKIKAFAIQEGINLSTKPIQDTVTKTSVYHLGRSSFINCLGMAEKISSDLGWKNIMAVYSGKEDTYNFAKQFILFGVIDLLGVASLFLVSSVYITKVLKPLEEGQKKQTAFVAAASHELRSPLTVIKAGINAIKEDNNKADQFLPHIEAECDRMTRLIGDMLLLASTDAKTWTLTKEQVDMDTLLIECYDMYCTCYNNKNYELVMELPEIALHKVTGDKERIKQILTILVDNAMSYSSPGGLIILRAYNNKHTVIIEVEDHGLGIREEDKDHIFERFYRADKSRNEKKHFGLGLSIAKELVDLHQGDILIKDTPGGGATFMIRFPV